MQFARHHGTMSPRAESSQRARICCRLLWSIMHLEPFTDLQELVYSHPFGASVSASPFREGHPTLLWRNLAASRRLRRGLRRRLARRAARPAARGRRRLALLRQHSEPSYSAQTQSLPLLLAGVDFRLKIHIRFCRAYA